MGQPVVHWEMLSRNPATLSDFYQKIFGWKVQHVPELRVPNMMTHVCVAARTD